MSNNQRWEPTTWDGSSRPHIIAKRSKRDSGTAWLSAFISATGLACMIGWGIGTFVSHVNHTITQQEVRK